jgi:mRNA interferase MazF
VVVVQRGEVWWAALPEPTGSGPGYRRPVLVVQADEFNRSAIRTVMVAVLTSNMGRAAAPGNVALTRKHSGLPRPSVVNVSQVVTLDRTRLTAKVRAVPATIMSEVDAGLRLSLAL